MGPLPAVDDVDSVDEKKAGPHDVQIDRMQGPRVVEHPLGRGNNKDGVTCEPGIGAELVLLQYSAQVEGCGSHTAVKFQRRMWRDSVCGWQKNSELRGTTFRSLPSRRLVSTGSFGPVDDFVAQLLMAYSIDVLGNVPIPNHWDREPKFHSRSELQKSRPNGIRPHFSYDLDGDGFVSQKDYRVSSSMDIQKKGFLTETERTAAKNSIQSVNPSRFVLGEARPSTAPQCDQQDATGSFKSRSALLNHRKLADRPGQDAHLMRERSKQKAIFMEHMSECQPIVNSGPATRPMRSEIAAEIKRDSRAHVGLTRNMEPINPARTIKALSHGEGIIDEMPGMGYQSSPAISTRSELLRSRKQGLVKDLEQTVSSYLVNFRSQSTRLQERENAAFVRREMVSQGASRAQMMEERKKGMVEDMNATFAETLHSVPQGNSEFATMHASERPAFWTLTSGYRAAPTFSSACTQRIVACAGRNQKNLEGIPPNPQLQDETHYHTRHKTSEATVVDHVHKLRPWLDKEPGHTIKPRAKEDPSIRKSKGDSFGSDATESAPNKQQEILELRELALPLFSSFSQSQAFDPKPIPRPVKRSLATLKDIASSTRGLSPTKGMVLVSLLCVVI